MTTATVDTEFDAIMASNKVGMENVLADDAEARSFGDRIRNAPKALKRYLSAVADFFHLSAAKEGAASAWAKTKVLLVRVLGPVRAVGILNIVGALLTCGKGREILTSVLGTAYRIVTKPLRLIGRAFGWLGRKVGLSKAVAKVETSIAAAEEYVACKFQSAMTWLDEREHHGAMRWGRSAYQGAIKGRLISRFAPQQLRTPLYIGALFVPNLGVHGYESPASVLKDTVANGSPEAEETPEVHNVTTLPTDAKAEVRKPVEVVEKFPVILVGTGARRQILRITDNNGRVHWRYNGKRYEEGQLPRDVQVQYPDTAAVAETIPAPPLNRAARREAVRNGQAASE